MVDGVYVVYRVARAVVADKAALFDAGLATPEAMAAASWQDRVVVLTTHGYKRYDESTARMLCDTAAQLRAEYAGDLRKLRAAAGADPKEERRRLRAFKGLGPVGVDIFCREAQLAWRELWPFADKKALRAAARLGLPDSAAGLARLVPEQDLPRLVAALVRTDLANDYDAIPGR